jgi:hypothetical protein
MFTIKKYISVFLLAVFSAFIVPKELIHECFHHHETEDCGSSTPSEGLAISQVHKHCLLLDHASEPVVLTPIYFAFTQIGTRCCKPVATHQSHPSRFFEFTFLRGPPTIF